MTLNALVENAMKEDPEQKKDFPLTKFKILKNVGVVSFCFGLLSLSFRSLSNLQSSLNKGGLGTGSLSIIYGSLLVSCMFLPTFALNKLGCKWTIASSLCCYTVYIAANFYAIWGIMAPSALILGLAAATLWSAKCTYLTQVAVWYSEMTGNTQDNIINQFFGFFFMVYQIGQILGNIMSSTILRSHPKNITLPSEDELKLCGSNFCPNTEENITNLARPETVKVYTLCGIYTGCLVAAVVLISLFLNKIKLDKVQHESESRHALSVFVATFQHLIKNDYQKLLIPLTIYSGIEQAFFIADFTKSYISCSIGIWYVGYVMICYGVVDAICSLSFGRLVQYVGRIPFFILVLLVHGGSLIAFLLWQPSTDVAQRFIFFIFAGLWGMGDAVIQTQINALYGYLFTDNPGAAFSNYHLWESIGFIIAYSYSDFLVTNIKIYVCMGFLIFGIFSCTIVEMIDRKHKNVGMKISFKAFNFKKT